MSSFTRAARKKASTELSMLERGHIKRQRSLQQKITIIILTDFVCWIPFIAVCGLHYLGIASADNLYAFFSIIVLPINSIINPFLYDDTFTIAISALLKKVRAHSFGCKTSDRLTVSRSDDSTAEKSKGGSNVEPEIADTRM